MPRVRLDSLLAERGLFESRTRAAAAVIAGAGPPRPRPSPRGEAGPAGRRRGRARGRRPAAVRLARRRQARQRARRARRRPVAGRRALDVGASTGGFTDCLLQRGAAHVIALDVAYGELDYRLREDARVTVIERTNARAHHARRSSRTRPDLIVIDVSFISLTKVLPAVLACAADRVRLPGDGQAAVRGRARSGSARAASSATPSCAARPSSDVADARALGAAVMGSAPSALAGPSGNRETFLWLAEGGAARRRRRGRGMVKRRRCLTHRRPSDTARGRRAADRDRPRAGASRCASRPTRRPSTRSRPAPFIEIVAELGRRRRPLHRPRRRRHDPHRPAPLRRHRRPGVRRQLRRGRVPGHDRPRRPRATTSSARSRASSTRSSCPTISVGRPDGHLERAQRHLRAPQGGPARRRPRVRARGRGDRPRALRRARRRHARRARRATTSPTAARCWPGAWRATSCRSSRRTR